MIKKKEGGNQVIDGKQLIQGQGYRQMRARGISSLTRPIFSNFIKARR
jgi:hypothetical protein